MEKFTDKLKPKTEKAVFKTTFFVMESGQCKYESEGKLTKVEAWTLIGGFEEAKFDLLSKIQNSKPEAADNAKN